MAISRTTSLNHFLHVSAAHQLFLHFLAAGGSNLGRVLLDQLGLLQLLQLLLLSFLLRKLSTSSVKIKSIYINR